MKKLLITIMSLIIVQGILSAQSAYDVSRQFAKLKKDLTEANTPRQEKEASKSLDAFLSNIHIEKYNSDNHNMIPFLSCSYDDMPLTIPVILRHGASADTIQFQGGKWYLTKDLSPDMELDFLYFENNVDPRNKQLQKAVKSMSKKHTLQLGEELSGKSDSLFFVKDENLYYAAIESSKIPAFSILSNSGIINYASCLKTILKASNIDASYDSIIGQYLHTTIDEQFIPTKNNSNTISGRKVVTTFVPQTDVDATEIVNELLKGRFVIAIDKNGNVGLLTAIALINEQGYEPVHVRMRLPMLTQGDQRVQMSWKDFCKRMVALVKVDIY